ncbi:MAG TPA: isoprenylcysteine carboxylmethyltransferase family protein [Nitrobacter sp.]|jgi:protein-S-isoprenylcysteine O-methyltransferase Ste14|nr:isoprenylcysteine carboxylmethyltransferase family protein [Nitrobacter sp.]
MQLLIRTLKTTIIGLIVFFCLIFVPAGTLAYWQGWAFVAVFIVSTTLIGLYLALANPTLLERRLKVGPAAETRPVQKIIITVSFTVFCLMLVVSVLDHRFGWSHVPTWLSVVGNVLVAFGLMMDLRVFRENSYGASTIEKTEGQKVIATGPYAVVRHPMYLGVLIMALGTPLALGSWWGIVLAIATVPILVLRILDEERMLCDELEGYEAYARDVRYRLLPGLW